MAENTTVNSLYTFERDNWDVKMIGKKQPGLFPPLQVSQNFSQLLGQILAENAYPLNNSATFWEIPLPFLNSLLKFKREWRAKQTSRLAAGREYSKFC